MVDPRNIFKFTDEIARRFKPRKIILFGSYAYGTPTEDSDVDVLVVKPYRGQSYRAASRIRVAIDVWFPLDLLVYSPAEVSRGLRTNDSLVREIIEQGITVYDANDDAMGRKGRRKLRKRHDAATFAQAAAVQ